MLACVYELDVVLGKVPLAGSNPKAGLYDIDHQPNTKTFKGVQTVAGATYTQVLLGLRVSSRLLIGVVTPCVGPDFRNRNSLITGKWGKRCANDTRGTSSE